MGNKVIMCTPRIGIKEDRDKVREDTRKQSFRNHLEEDKDRSNRESGERGAC